MTSYMVCRRRYGGPIKVEDSTVTEGAVFKYKSKICDEDAVVRKMKRIHINSEGG